MHTYTHTPPPYTLRTHTHTYPHTQSHVSTPPPPSTLRRRTRGFRVSTKSLVPELGRSRSTPTRSGPVTDPLVSWTGGGCPDSPPPGRPVTDPKSEPDPFSHPDECRTSVCATSSAPSTVVVSLDPWDSVRCVRVYTCVCTCGRVYVCSRSTHYLHLTIKEVVRLMHVSASRSSGIGNPLDGFQRRYSVSPL